MPTSSELRAIALSLPEVAEQDHHGMNSFRVRGRIFATVPDAEHLRIMASEEEIRAAVAAAPATYAPLYFGGRLACVVAELSSAEVGRLRELLLDAWLRKAPRSIADAVADW